MAPWDLLGSHGMADRMQSPLVIMSSEVKNFLVSESFCVNQRIQVFPLLAGNIWFCCYLLGGRGCFNRSTISQEDNCRVCDPHRWSEQGELGQTLHFGTPSKMAVKSEKGELKFPLLTKVTRVTGTGGRGWPYFARSSHLPVLLPITHWQCQTAMVLNPSPRVDKCLNAWICESLLKATTSQWGDLKRCSSSQEANTRMIMNTNSERFTLEPRSCKALWVCSQEPKLLWNYQRVFKVQWVKLPALPFHVLWHQRSHVYF